MSYIQISLEAHIWQAIWTDSAFLANIICSFTKGHFMYIDLLILINFNTQKCRYVSYGKHKWHVSTNWMWHNDTMLVTSHHTCWGLCNPTVSILNVTTFPFMKTISTKVRCVWKLRSYWDSRWTKEVLWLQMIIESSTVKVKE